MENKNKIIHPNITPTKIEFNPKIQCKISNFIQSIDDVLKTNWTWEIYNNTAELYDEDIETQAFFMLENAKVLEMLDIQQWENILDLWCWTGKYIQIFPKKPNIYWSDISKNMIEISKRKNQNTPVKYSVCDISKWLPFPDGFFDKINCSHVLKFLTSQNDLEFAFREIFRVLKKWWTFVFTNNHPERNFDWNDYELIKPNNWKQDNTETDTVISMKLHKIQDYEKACKKAWLKAIEIVDVMINQDIKNMLTKESFEKVNGKRIIIAMKIIKP